MANQLQPAIYSLILAGGQASRMGHTEKGLVHFNGEPMIAYAIDALLPVSDVLAISCNKRQSDYHTVLNQRAIERPVNTPSIHQKLRDKTSAQDYQYGEPKSPILRPHWLVEDKQLPFSGPVAGIISFLFKLEEKLRTVGGIQSNALCVVSSCDMPLLTRSTIELLIKEAIEHSANSLHFSRSSDSKTNLKEEPKGAYLPMIFNAKAGLSLAHSWGSPTTPLPKTHYSLKNWLGAIAKSPRTTTFPSYMNDDQLISVNTLESLKALADKPH